MSSIFSPVRLEDKEWIEVSIPRLERDDGIDASGLMVPELGINTMAIHYYRCNITIRNPHRILIVDLLNYEDNSCSTEFVISKLFKMSILEKEGGGGAKLVIEFMDYNENKCMTHILFTDRECAEKCMADLRYEMNKDRIKFIKEMIEDESLGLTKEDIERHQKELDELEGK